MSDPGARSRTMGLEPVLHAAQLDDLGRALLLLARELWVTKDRLAVLEQVLGGHGLNVEDAVRDFQPDGAFATRLASERRDFAAALMAALVPEGSHK